MTKLPNNTFPFWDKMGHSGTSWDITRKSELEVLIFFFYKTSMF